MKIGPVGRVRGEAWDHKGQSQVVQIFLSFGPRYLNSLSFQYFKDGGLVTSEIIGRQTFSRDTFQTIVLDYPSEYIVEVNGVYSSYIEELTIVTNRKHHVCKTFQGRSRNNYNSYSAPPPNNPRNNRYGAYGGSKLDRGKWFKLDIGRLAQFGGFHGTHDSKGVRSVGVYVDPITTLGAYRTAPIENEAYGGINNNVNPNYY